MSMMQGFDYMAPAELFTASHRSKRAALKYHRFTTSAEAIRFAMEGLSPEQLYGTVLEVGETRFDAEAIRELYGHAEFPLQRLQPQSG